MEGNGKSESFDERGRELKASELRMRTVYVLEKADHPLVTMWHTGGAGAMVEFYSGLQRLHLWLRVAPDGTLVDDSGAQIHVYEYLGEI